MERMGFIGLHAIVNRRCLQDEHGLGAFENNAQDSTSTTETK
jgi:hypothetical protein